MAVCVCVCVRDTGLLQHGIDACDTYKFLDANKCRLCALFLRCASAPKNAVCGNAKRPQGALFGHNQRVLLAHRHIAWFAYVCATCTEVERGGERWREVGRVCVCACVRVCACVCVCASSGKNPHGRRQARVQTSNVLPRSRTTGAAANVAGRPRTPLRPHPKSETIGVLFGLLHTQQWIKARTVTRG